MKLAGEMLVRDYSRKNPQMVHTILRPSAVYGELDVEDRVMSKFMLAALRNHPLYVNGANETLDFTFVDDAADGIVAATFSDATHNNTYNITKSHATKLVDAAKMVTNMAAGGEIVIRPKDQDFPSRGALNIEAARNDFGFNPKVTIQDGFHRYMEWFKSSPFWQKKITRLK